MERGRLEAFIFPRMLSVCVSIRTFQPLFALLENGEAAKVESVSCTCFMHGRDTRRKQDATVCQQLQQKMRELGVGKIATWFGRYYAMDATILARNQLAYRSMVHGEQ